MKKALVCGAGGFIGGHLVKYLKAKGYWVRGIDLKYNEFHHVEEVADHFVIGDLRDPYVVAAVIDEEMDEIYQLAADMGGAGFVFTGENDADIMHNSALINLNVAHEAAKKKVKRVFYSSSSEVYGEPVELPQHEQTTPLNSRVPYAVVKNVGESFFRSYQKVFGLPYTIFRFFNTYGPNQSKDFVISKFLTAALQGDDITIYGNGRQTRTFCYVDDNINACLKIFEDNHMINDVINIGGAQEYKIIDVAKTIISLTGSSSKIIHLPPLPEGDMTRRMPDNSKMLNILNKQLISLEDGVKMMMDHPDFNT